MKLLSCVWLFVTPLDCSLPGSSAHGILQARVLECVAIFFSRGSSQPRDRRTWVSRIAGECFYRLSHFYSNRHVLGTLEFLWNVELPAPIHLVHFICLISLPKQINFRHSNALSSKCDRIKLEDNNQGLPLGPFFCFCYFIFSLSLFFLVTKYLLPPGNEGSAKISLNDGFQTSFWMEFKR